MKKIFLFIACYGLLLVVAFLSIVDYQSIGYNPKGEHLAKISKSPQYDLKLKTFVNANRLPIKKMKEKINTWEQLAEYFLTGRDKSPKKKLPQVKPSLTRFLAPSNGIKYIWLGHSSFMVRIKNKTILFDPVLSESASPFRFTVQRFQKPILKLSELPPIDYIVISHDHYDHLDRVTSEFFINKDTHFITPLGVSAHLIGWGVPKERVTELDWWGELSIDGLNFVCTPAQHFSGRQGMDGGKTLWSSWIVQDERSRIYFSGDTGYGDHFKEIGKRFGPFDIVFMENGQYNKRWQAVHMMPEEWPQAFKDLQGKHYMPVHWGMFDLSFHSWYEPIVKIDELARMNNFSLLAPKVGEIVDLSTGYHSVKWWENYVR